MSVLPVIMAGGSGSRLWPLSRELFPKQFLALNSHRSLLQETLLRLDGINNSYPLVICNEEHRFLVAEQLRLLDRLAGNIILEPAGRNTAPAVALAALIATARGEDPVLLILAADHVIQDSSAFQSAINTAIPYAENGKLVTFGIVPQKPETGYGYIRKGGVLSESAYSVACFVEKPDLQTAQNYIASGEYYWNSGMFVFKASRYLEELEKYRPDIFAACHRAIHEINLDLDFLRVNEQAFLQCPEDSIDYAVMENTSDAVVVSMDAGWSDVGSWSALWDIADKDINNNVIRGDVILQNVKDSFIYSDTLLVSALGVDNLVVVQTSDAILVANKDHVQDVKKIVEDLKKKQRSEYRNHREVYRPWGKYDSLDNGERYQVKHITVKPGAKLSVQMHHHRAEHWVVVSGVAKVTNGDTTYLVAENESTYIPVGAIHALENPGKIDLELIEVQSGGYLGEDDIVRLEDKYGRT
jgi:mannose-1-phosphate guanylyltransferase